VPPWDNFFVAQVGASAALAGLLFVGLSINMARILQYAILLDRALQALTLLVAILVIASLELVPGASPLDLGVEVLVAAGAAGAAISVLTARVLRHIDRRWRRPVLWELALTEGCVATYLAGGAVLIAAGAVGVDLLVPAILASYLSAILTAWVLLVEINR
jgi:hypothetical protein